MIGFLQLAIGGLARCATAAKWTTEVKQPTRFGQACHGRRCRIELANVPRLRWLEPNSSVKRRSTLVSVDVALPGKGLQLRAHLRMCAVRSKNKVAYPAV